MPGYFVDGQSPGHCDMIDEQDKPEKAAHLRERFLAQHESRTDEERYCDHMWDEALNV